MEQDMSMKGLLVSSVVAAAGVAFVVCELSRQRKKIQKNRASHSGGSLWHTMIQKRILQPVDNSVTFGEFPYYLSHKTREQLVNAAFMHLKLADLRFFANSVPALLLSGPPESALYQQALGKALAKHFDAKLLLLDVSDLLAKAKTSSDPLSSPLKLPMQAAVVAAAVDILDALLEILAAEAALGPIICFVRDVQHALFTDRQIAALVSRKLQNLPGKVFLIGSHTACTKCEHKGMEETMCSTFPTRVFVKPPSDEVHRGSWSKQMEADIRALQSADNINLLCTVMVNHNVACEELDQLELASLALNYSQAEEIVGWAISHHLMNCNIPEMESGRLVLPCSSLEYSLKLSASAEMSYMEAKLKVETQTESKEMQDSAGKSEVKAGIAKADADGSRTEVPKADTPAADAPKVPVGAVPAKGSVPAASPPKKAPEEESPDNEFEKRIRPEVIPANAVGVTFDSIGALDNVKESLRELVMLPLQRPELFKEGGLIQPCKGILLFGPPGTGKTMLAKAVATEAGANFINISMSTITSKWFGEDEKNVRALFTLAAKIAPTVIFIDEVDSMLGRRSRAGEHEAMRKIKNEFMAHWDGLMSKSSGVLVLAATNRPFDLDEAIIRRFQRRIMVGLPDGENRQKILRSILGKENLAPDFDFKELADMTDGHSGSDLKNLCVTAAYRPIRELLANEKKEQAVSALKEQQKEKPAAAEAEREGQQEANSQEQMEGKEEMKESKEEVKEDKPASAPKAAISLRPLSMEDLRQAKSQFAASVATDSATMAELNEWNEMYGEGGSRKKTPLTYFL